jgi:hypothetical protein
MKSARAWFALLAAAAAAVALVACKSEEQKQREWLAAPLARARPFLDATRKASTLPGPVADCNSKPVPRPTVVFEGPELERVFDLSKAADESGSALWRNPQGHPCWTFDTVRTVRALELFVQQGKLDVTGGTVGAASTMAECGEGIASFVVIYTKERVDMKLVEPKTFLAGSATVRAVVYSKAGVPTCEQSFSFLLDQRTSLTDAKSATELNISLQSATVVQKAFGLTP